MEVSNRNMEKMCKEQFHKSAVHQVWLGNQIWGDRMGEKFVTYAWGRWEKDAQFVVLGLKSHTDVLSGRIFMKRESGNVLAVTWLHSWQVAAVEGFRDLTVDPWSCPSSLDVVYV
jgi:hypothetical protein